METKRPWDSVEQDLLDNVFYAYEADAVRAADDLSSAGMLDSLSVVAILETLLDATNSMDGDESLEAAGASDFRNLGNIRALYERV